MLVEPGNARCSHCGTEGLRWQWMRGGYRLVNCIDQVHDCEAGRVARRRAYLRAHPAIMQAARVSSDLRSRLRREGLVGRVVAVST